MLEDKDRGDRGLGGSPEGRGALLLCHHLLQGRSEWRQGHRLREEAVMEMPLLFRRRRVAGDTYAANSVPIVAARTGLRPF